MFCCSYNHNYLGVFRHFFYFSMQSTDFHFYYGNKNVNCLLTYDALRAIRTAETQKFYQSFLFIYHFIDDCSIRLVTSDVGPFELSHSPYASMCFSSVLCEYLLLVTRVCLPLKCIWFSLAFVQCLYGFFMCSLFFAFRLWVLFLFGRFLCLFQLIVWLFSFHFC